MTAGSRANGARFWIVTTTYGDRAEAEVIQDAIIDGLQAAAERRPPGWNLDVDIIEVDEPARYSAGISAASAATESPLGDP